MRQSRRSPSNGTQCPQRFSASTAFPPACFSQARSSTYPTPPTSRHPLNPTQPRQLFLPSHSQVMISAQKRLNLPQSPPVSTYSVNGSQPVLSRDTPSPLRPKSSDSRLWPRPDTTLFRNLRPSDWTRSACRDS